MTRLAWGPRCRAIAVLVTALSAAGLVWARDPDLGTGFSLPCLWHVATSLHCPGCGMTRALHDLLHGRVVEALDHDAFGVVLLAGVATALVRPAWIALVHDRWRPPSVPARAGWWLLALALLWTILRNLPWAPFEVLAP